ncbi:outer membrane beta-barrel protein [Pseudochrobactrum asaccharolyticum]|uniref:outer membrane beta-barrel protein n=1 Tax=Pseudochrobactrum asaccharolyticum TaxID=354351 RepID=UPI004041B4F2
MKKTADTGHFTPLTLRGLHKAALLAGVVLFAISTASQAQTVAEEPLPDVADITYDANGRIIEQPAAPIAAPALNTTSIPLSDDMGGLRTGPAESGRATREGRENMPEGSVDGRPRAPFEADPFEPQGLRAGSFILRPSLDLGIRATSNADNSASGSSGVLSETALRLNARSDWASHLATLDATGIFEKNLSRQYVSNPRGQIDAALRLDMSDDTRLNFGLGYSVNREDASDPNGISAARTRPLVHNLSAQAGVERDIGKIFARAVARVNNTRYGNAKLFNGDQLDQSDRNNTYVSMTLRGGFEVSAIIRPFAEVEVGRRLYQNDNGLDRNATQLGLRTGLQINSGEKLNGEFSVGYISARSEDDRLRDTGGLSLDAAMNWSPQRGTDVQFGLRTYLDSSPDIGGNSSILYLANINVTRMIRADLSLNARLDASVRDNHDGSGTDYGMGAEAGATYWFNRFFGVDGKLRHEFIKSDVASRDYQSNSVYLGVKLRR